MAEKNQALMMNTDARNALSSEQNLTQPNRGNYHLQSSKRITFGSIALALESFYAYVDGLVYVTFIADFQTTFALSKSPK